MVRLLLLVKFNQKNEYILSNIDFRDLNSKVFRKTVKKRVFQYLNLIIFNFLLRILLITCELVFYNG